MPRTREDHRHAAFVAEFDRVLVAFAAARLDDGGDAGVDQDLRAVVEGEEGVGGSDTAGEFFAVALLFCEPRRDSSAHDAAHLARAVADQHAVANNADRVGLCVFADQPREAEVSQLCVCR